MVLSSDQHSVRLVTHEFLTDAFKAHEEDEAQENHNDYFSCQRKHETVGTFRYDVKDQHIFTPRVLLSSSLCVSEHVRHFGPHAEL